ncbi:HEPN domain-containing protein [candidate division KSB1 bacterium]|nr:HEPN domain-containing protein [candidate division KSB1 bacterium]MBL7093124.1 HEPN domain-containing protein [candidate division KSB1 bacterium]
MNKKIQYWLDIAEYDLETAKSMLNTKRFLYVGFMCHQVIEKGLKAYYAYFKNATPPYSHNLTQLAEKREIIHSMSEEQLNFLDILQPLNIEARYPSYKEKLLQTLDEKKCKQIIKNTKELHQWLKNQLLTE